MRHVELYHGVELMPRRRRRNDADFGMEPKGVGALLATPATPEAKLRARLGKMMSINMGGVDVQYPREDAPPLSLQAILAGSIPEAPRTNAARRHRR